jgi:tetratricopeptide (TPR) repeat protein
VRDLAPLLTRFDPAALRPAAGATPAAGLSGLRTWVIREAKKRTPQAVLLAAGVARAAGELDWAGELLADAEAVCTGDDCDRLGNERAALAWQRGDAADALARWEALSDSPAVRFNRGMALLFLGRSAEARAALTAAIDVLPDGSGWRDLAELYRTLAEIHG